MPILLRSGSNVIDINKDRANLFEITFSHGPKDIYVVRREVGGRARESYHLVPIDGAERLPSDPIKLRWAVKHTIDEALEAEGLRPERHRFRTIVVDRSKNLSDHIGILFYLAFDLSILDFSGTYFLCIDPHLKTHALLPISLIMRERPSYEFVPGQRMRVKKDGVWIDAELLQKSEDDCTIKLDGGVSTIANASHIYPDLTKAQILDLCPLLGITKNDIERHIKRLSFLTTDNASVSRLAATSEFAEKLSERSFPITRGNLVIGLDPEPAHLLGPTFDLRRDLVEPPISFDQVDVTKRGPNILSGLTRFGAYESPVRPLNVALVTTED